MSELQYQLDREVVIRASRDTVFRYFTDSARWARWWGAGSTIDARPGGKMYIRHGNGVEFVGEVLEVSAPDRIVFTYGNASGTPIPAGGSRVTISLTDQGSLTRLHLVHEVADATVRDQNVQGWRYQLSLFSNIVADEVTVHAATAIDTWFDAWAEPDEAKRAAMFASIAGVNVTCQDKFSSLADLPEVVAHSGAWQRFMPGVRLNRRGDVRHCQGMVIADWNVSVRGEQKAPGSSVFIFGPDGMIESATGFWS